MEIFYDEAGRWPLAWPLYIGLVISKSSREFLKTCPLFRDSKKLSEKQRELALQDIQTLMINKKLIATVASVDNTFIDSYGITKSLFTAICEGLYELLTTCFGEKAQEPFELTDLIFLIKTREQKHQEEITLVLDGNSDFWIWKALDIGTETIVHGDDTLPEISIASILAKVNRDHAMYEFAKKYPDYHFEKHKGYGTKIHYQAIEKHGISPIHRKLFLRKYFLHLES